MNQVTLSLTLLGFIMAALIGFLFYQMTWWYWHPNAILAIIRGKDRKRNILKITPKDGKFKYKKGTYTVSPELCDSVGKFNSLTGVWNEGISNQLDLVNVDYERTVAARILADAELNREDRLVQRAINPFAGGYVSPVIQIVITAAIVLVGIAVMLGTVLPKVGQIQSQIQIISDFIGVPGNDETTETPN